MPKIPGRAHQDRFRRWQRRLPAVTRFLSELVEKDLVEKVERSGFSRVDYSFHETEWPVDANDIHLERVHDDLIDYVSIGFKKWGLPRFQIGFGRRLLPKPHEWVRSAHLVARSSQYYHFWGKPWWMPFWAWSDKNSNRAVLSVQKKLDQAFRFLETGERGPNISRPTS